MWFELQAIASAAFILPCSILVGGVLVGFGCSDDRVVVRTELLPFEPKARLVLEPLSLADSEKEVAVRVLDGPIETARAFYCDLEISQMSPSGSECSMVTVTATPANGAGKVRTLGHELISQRHLLPFHISKVVQPPLEIAGRWQGIVTMQEGPDGIRLGPARKVAEFTFDVIESKASAPPK